MRTVLPTPVWLAILVATVAFAGCAAPPSTDPAPRASGPIVQGSLEGFDHLLPGSYNETPWSDDARPTHDPRAPAVTKDGEPSFALAVLIRETWTLDDGTMRERHPCGGVVIATPELWPDPRPHLDAFAWNGSATVVDERGRAWTTERYVVKANTSKVVWVQNIGGGPDFTPDNDAHCRAPMYDHGPLNALLHVDGLEKVEVWYRPDARPS